jgi:hypothetical protein
MIFTGEKTNMKTKRILSAVLAAALLITSYGVNTVFAADIPVQPAPTNLNITALNPNTEPPIGYSATDGGESGYYADMSWNVANPGQQQGITLAGKYVNLYLEESQKGYGTAKTTVVKDLPGDTTPSRIRNLKSGTIYKANAKAYYQYTTAAGTNILKSAESVSSNTLKFLTDINVQCVTAGTDKFKIIWDDVWNNGKRINYKLYVSDNKDFTNTLPIYITDEQIKDNGPVVVNKTDGTLEYVHNVSDAGRVYYVKIVPDISDPDIIKTPESHTVLVSTYILVKTTRMSTTNDGSIVWRLDWSPVVTGLSTTNIKVQYSVNKYENGIAKTMFVQNGTTTFITVPANGQDNSYMIRANVTKDGVPLYPDSIKIVSDKITLKEQEVPSTPSMPELVSQFKDMDGLGSVIISCEDVIGSDGSVVHKGELGKDTATVLWRVPKKADGSIDQDVLYDIWLIEDPNTIDNPAKETSLVKGFKPDQSNYIIDTKNNNKVVGYKYKLDGLLSNHTYYFKIVAKKSFAEDVNGVIQNVEHVSTPALKVITTLPGGGIDTPLLPSNPPLEIKEKPVGKDIITDNSVTIQTKNRWYEKFDSKTGKWNFVKADKTSLSDTVDYNPADPLTPADNLNFRKVQYGQGVSLYVGCEEYKEGIDISTIQNYKLQKVDVTPNDPDEDPTLNAPENTTGAAIYAKHNIVIPVKDLKPNTTYILWVRAARDGDPVLFSDTSNPIIFTTLPTAAQTVEKPVVPAITYTYSGDTYVDLGWDYKDGYTYYIKYATVDDPSKAGQAITVTTSQIKQSNINYVRIPGLKPDTQYYFWIQAEAFSQDGTASQKSDWSDSTPLRTLKDIPPATPRGFGVKNTKDAVTKNSVTFEWIKESNMQYILEVASSVDYKDVVQYKAGEVSEFTVSGLKSNFRYFARLYAYDPAKKLTSLPTQSISVRTLRSSDDYDSDKDIDNVISGPYVDKAATVVNGVWVVKITGVNADRLIEVMMTDNKLDYTVDVSKPPSTANSISIYISKKVFDKLEQLKENIAFKAAAVSYNLKAGILSNYADTPDTQKEQIYLFSITLLPQKPSSVVDELLLKQPLAQMGVTLDTGVSNIPVTGFAVPLVVNYPYSTPKDYVDGKTFGYIYNSGTGNWEKQTSSGQYDTDTNSGVISFQSKAPGLFAVADRTNALFDDIYGNEYESSIVNVAFAHRLKSVKGRMFEPDSDATIGDAVKLTFDTLDYEYGSEYMDSAAKAGFTAGSIYPGNICTRQEAACMAVTLYEKKAATKAQADSSALSGYSDYTKVDKAIIGKVAFAVENGFIPKAASDKLNPTEPVTRGELMYMIEKALALAGEIE